LRGQIASVLILTALIVGVVIGYIGNESATETVTTTYTFVTTTLQGPVLERCTVTQYAVWSVESLGRGTTVGGTTTQDYAVATYQTTGFPTVTTSSYAGTLTGAIASWKVTTCG